MVYFEFAPEVLQQLEKDSYNWASLREFADSMLAKIAAKELESAYTEWMQTILKLKEEAGQPDSLKVLDVALAGHWQVAKQPMLSKPVTKKKVSSYATHACPNLAF